MKMGVFEYNFFFEEDLEVEGSTKDMVFGWGMNALRNMEEALWGRGGYTYGARDWLSLWSIACSSVTTYDIDWSVTTYDID